MPRDQIDAGPLKGVPSHERHFYALTRAIGRFGMRLFEPSVMDAPHWHGHVEGNFITGATMIYDVDGVRVHVPEGRLILFWAGLPHQLVEVTPTGTGTPRLANIYLPLDAFLFMPHIARLQVSLLGGAIAALPEDMVTSDCIEGWYKDYRANEYERLEIMKMELNALLRRALLDDIPYLLAPLAEIGEERILSSAHIRHVVAMVKHILEHLSEPLTNADVAAVTGLHQNYALSLFSRTMRLPMKKFIIRMRLLRARALLMGSSMGIGQVVEQSGFTSTSQFYDHFRSAYGLSPHQMRARYTQMELR
ncbi:helix-turn-helix domain-containing protein [Pelagovum pacificum]|uniref:Helix-turn-helix domain-containing protein n=1 Tax=Pelagovum pacificum TaxID=2588711 RepID=A0A5C5GHJ0_9RHOB|nr:helix-turn-helix domain-containing protein [Pelagovum pacificum]QQA42792.1 helix-turn-helix domain-containing protein [Pelagovum pacificum]TNY34060.1 helix-turn-helix domain-containing protein [Pelagovum pacificum]